MRKGIFDADEFRMEKVRKMDTELIRLSGGMEDLSRILYAFMGAVAVITTGLAGGSQTQQLYIWAPLIYTNLAMLYLMRYMTVREKKGQVSVYEKFRYAPVTKQDIAVVRVAYWTKFTVPRAIAGLVLTPLMALAFGNLNLISMLYPLAIGVFAWLIGVAHIYSPGFWFFKA